MARQITEIEHRHLMRLRFLSGQSLKSTSQSLQDCTKLDEIDPEVRSTEQTP